MGSTTLKFGAEDSGKIPGAMPSMITSTHDSNSLGNESNAAGSSRVSDFGALEQYLGFRVGDAANVGHGPTFPTVNSQTMSSGLHSSMFNKSLASSTGTNFSLLIAGSEAMQLRKGSQLNLASSSGFQYENLGEMNIDSSSHTETSTDADLDDRNKTSETGQYLAAAVSDSSDKSKDKTKNQKTQRRLAQNREAARKSRLRKKAYVQQLEQSRLKLTQLEQELKSARQQGIFISSTGDHTNSGSNNGTVAFDTEYARWMEEQNRWINELRTAVDSRASDADLRGVIDKVTAQFYDVFRLKENAAKVDVFHILSGMWKMPAERCFMWIGGFRPSELLKLLVNQLEPLTEQQLAGICNLQQSSHQAEEALTQGMEALQQSLAETLASDSSRPEGLSGNVANYMGQMAMAMGKLGTLEGFLRQADNLRQQTLQQMHRSLTTRQSARALLLINDYFSRLRALSSLWLARPRE